jgi:hypothetical protein
MARLARARTRSWSADISPLFRSSAIPDAINVQRLVRLCVNLRTRNKSFARMTVVADIVKQQRRERRGSGNGCESEGNPGSGGE